LIDDVNQYLPYFNPTHTQTQASNPMNIRRFLSAALIVWSVQALAEDTKDLFAAAATGKLDRVEALLAQGLDVNGKLETDRTALMAASFNGNLRIVKALLAYGADVNLADKLGSTALTDAVMFGNADIVGVLIAAGANVNAADSQSVKILDKAKKLGRENIVKLLEAAGAKGSEAKVEEKIEGEPKAEEEKKAGRTEKMIQFAADRISGFATN